MRGIMFSDEMALAIKTGEKTQTRRLTGLDALNKTTNTRNAIRSSSLFYDRWEFYKFATDSIISMKCPYGLEGDTLYVKQRWRTYQPPDRPGGILFANNSFVKTPDNVIDQAHWLKLHQKRNGDNFRPAMFMPSHWALQHVRLDKIEVKRLQSISWGDAAAEGVTAWGERSCPGCVGNQCPKYVTECPIFVRGYIEEYRKLWNKINGAKMPWELNPWVWKLTFTRMKP